MFGIFKGSKTKIGNEPESFEVAIKALEDRFQSQIDALINVIQRDQKFWDEDKVQNKQLFRLLSAVRRANFFEHVQGGYVLSDKDADRIFKVLTALEKVEIPQ